MERGSQASRAGMAALALGALGVVFGDIGTSPLYALQTVFAAQHHHVQATPTAVYGVVSLVFWTITIIVSIKYVTLIMRADNDGEGGIMALIALVQSSPARRRLTQVALVSLGVFGASLFYGDGMITPAISVLSAVEGLKVAAPSVESLVIPITVAILTGLFAIQRFGTGAVGNLFGPVMAVWFVAIGLAGLNEVARHPEILRAVSPVYAARFLGEHSGTAFVALGAVVLTVTGAEALYADMGHFGRAPIRRAWFLVALPSLMLSYAGQGALLLHTPTAVSNPFYLLVPHWGRLPMVFLATAATVIASQAVISGAFSMSRQAVALGFLPRLTVLQTSRQHIGQIYVPAINWALFVAVVGLVLGFRSSSSLASAYGLAVTGTMAATTVLFLFVVRMRWHHPWPVVLAGAAVFLTVELTFFAANLPKVPHGGWFPLVSGVLVYTVLMTWRRGREIVTAKRIEQEGPLRKFVEDVRHRDPPVYRAPRTGVFLNASRDTAPIALRINVDHNNAMQASVVIVTVRVLKVPHVPEFERLTVDDLGYADDGIVLLTAHFGFTDTVDVPATLRLARKRLEGNVDPEAVSYFLSRVAVVPTRAPGMALWRKKLYVAMSRNSANPVAYFGLPDERTVVVGSHIEL